MNQHARGLKLDPTTVRAVLLDLDGTLLHTVPDLAAAANAMLTDMNSPVLAEDLISSFVGKGADNLIHRCLSAAGDLGAVEGSARFMSARKIFYRHYADLNGQHAKIYPGVLKGLDQMRALGIKLGVVTNKPQVFSDPLLARVGLADYFEVVLGGDALAYKKPRPEPLWHACERLQVTPAQTLFVGDSINDALAARAAGMRVLAVPYGYNEGNPVEDLDVDGIVQSLEQIFS
jgi:phosphoglycolate phosphatase